MKLTTEVETENALKQNAALDDSSSINCIDKFIGIVY